MIAQCRYCARHRRMVGIPSACQRCHREASAFLSGSVAQRLARVRARYLRLGRERIRRLGINA